MENTLRIMERCYNNLNRIVITGDSAELLVDAKRDLRAAYAQIERVNQASSAVKSAAENEVTDNGGQDNR